MGATASTQAEPISEGEKMTAEEMQLRQIEQIPTYKPPETFEQKLYRKVSFIY